jgi:hypothetical protein
MDGDTGEFTPINTITYDESVPLNSILTNRLTVSAREAGIENIFRNLPRKVIKGEGLFFNPRKGNEWSLQITAQSHRFRDFYNFIGVSGSSLEGYDHRDLTEPPIISGGVTLYFPHPEWGDKAGNYATDFRPPQPMEKVFQFVVESPKNTEVELGWPNLSDILDELSFNLVDLNTNQIIEMRPGEIYQYNSRNKQKRAFQVIVTHNP